MLGHLEVFYSSMVKDLKLTWPPAVASGDEAPTGLVARCSSLLSNSSGSATSNLQCFQEIMGSGCNSDASGKCITTFTKSHYENIAKQLGLSGGDSNRLV